MNKGNNKAFSRQRIKQFMRIVPALLVLVSVCLATLPVLSSEPLQGAPRSGWTTKPPAETVEIPRVLSPSDAALYREIFALGTKGRWKAVDQRIGQLDDPVLLGHVLAQRYLHPRSYRSRYRELSAWLATYADHPDAEKIYKLARSRKPRSAKAPQRPTYPEGVFLGSKIVRASPPPVPSASLSRKGQRQANALKQKIRRELYRGTPERAEKLLTSKSAHRLFSPAQQDELAAHLGHVYFTEGRDREAFQWTHDAALRSGRYVPHADWIAGLSAWQLGNLDTAAKHFETLAQRQDVSDHARAGAAFWAARSHMVDRRPDQVIRWLQTAASHTYGFYGQLARHILGAPAPFEWTLSADDQGALETVVALPGGRRALALIESGQTARAEAELRRLTKGASPGVTRGAVILALQSDSLDLAIKLNSRLNRIDAGLDIASYPVPPWTPPEGFTVDRALVFAVMRQESLFNPRAKSRAGARGLMQLMPATARYVARKSGERYGGVSRLYEPYVNLRLAQEYIHMLLADKSVGGNLSRLTAAWNGGPGNLMKWWQRGIHGDDPLLFIESIPLRETRRFVQKVLANLWVYRDRFGQPTPSLDTLAAGSWPTYTPLDPDRTEVAFYGKN